MGAGFAIAMRDLEIRGAGNILGTEQSGHIAAVGYELYCQLLEQAVAPAQAAAAQDDRSTSTSTCPCEAYLPRGYVPDMRLKIDLYRRLARVANVSELDDFRAELVDRFGPPPPAVQQLLLLAEVRIAAHRWRITFDPPGGSVRGLPLSSGKPLQRVGRPEQGPAEGGRRPKCVSAAGERRYGLRPDSVVPRSNRCCSRSESKPIIPLA